MSLQQPPVFQMPPVASITVYEILYQLINLLKETWLFFHNALFYPIQAIKLTNIEFQNASLLNTRSIFIFAEYMHKSWWYGFELFENEDYIIGIIPDANTFKPITNSLFEFLELYLEDSSKLYDYS